MTFVYWGGVNSGSDHLNRLLGFNKKPHVMVVGGYSFDKYTYIDDKEHITSYFRTTRNETKTKTRIKRVKDPRKEVAYFYMEKYNFIDNRRKASDYTINHSKLSDQEEQNVFRYGSSEDVSDCIPYLNQNKWHVLLSDIFDTETIIRPTFLLDDDISTSYIMDCINLVPYKTDIIDTLIHKLNIFDIKKQSTKYTKLTGRPVFFRTIEDAYKRDKEIVWGHLDGIIGGQRDIEQKLIDKNIPYQYFNLDEETYSIFDCPISVPNDFTSGKFEKNENWHKIHDYAMEYVTLRKLTDMRLSGRMIDRI